MCLGKENNKMSKTVTGCIVTYNNIATIDNAVGSLLEHTKAPFRLYVVDNGSTDGTIELIQEKYPQVTLIKSGGNIGFAVEVAVLEIRLLGHLRLAERLVTLDDEWAREAHFPLDEEGDLDAGRVPLGVGRDILELAGVLQRLDIPRHRDRIVGLADRGLATARHGRGVAPKAIKSLDLDIGHVRRKRHGAEERENSKNCFHKRPLFYQI